MPFHMLNAPIHLVGGVDRHKTRRRAQPSGPALRTKPSSVLRRTGMLQSRSFELGSSPRGSGFNSPVLCLHNTIGIIGGVSAVSTLSFLEKLVRWSLRDGEESLPFIVCDDPMLKRELSFGAKSSIPCPSSRNAHAHFDLAVVVENLRRKRLFLERSGARCIVMPCNISHTWYNEVSEGCSVPFLHVGECVAKELKAANLRPMEVGSNLHIGVLATNSTFTASFYQEKLRSQGLEVLSPDKATMEHTVIPAVEAFNRKDMEGARNLLRIGLQALLMRAVNTIILASDEMPGILPWDDPLLKKCLDPMDALVRSTIQWAKSIKEGEI